MSLRCELRQQRRPLALARHAHLREHVLEESFTPSLRQSRVSRLTRRA